MRIDRLERAGLRLLMLTPEEHVRVGRERLTALRSSPLGSTLDRQIQDAVLAAGTNPEVLILRGGSDSGRGSWRFADDLSSAECEELGYLLLRSQVAIYRELVELGVLLFLKVEWGPREIGALDAGRTHRLTELAAGPRTPEAEFEAWMLRHFSNWLLSSLDESEGVITRTLSRVGARRAVVAKMLEATRT